MLINNMKHLKKEYKGDNDNDFFSTNAHVYA